MAALGVPPQGPAAQPPSSAKAPPALSLHQAPEWQSPPPARPLGSPEWQSPPP
eukprot:CAMPEP_0203926554 /NCGR_PEP_ID=MMETSP0359-20131031/66075_1 /ASSEMBLY_ACC=CAM_ASM_000338 /TAXON_ID=268821 /ORGANISM="Scrippsiella Hangoei, Strain SHTV-5" /LENGTH=52 /DNA_ID=CAMNT_0050855175 /DNA_START=36 /DNA_END=191 /DNA_ORIENTATION=+